MSTTAKVLVGTGIVVGVGVVALALWFRSFHFSTGRGGIY
jgi:multisubunit Na+/H+ antiporter MnhC subunit